MIGFKAHGETDTKRREWYVIAVVNSPESTFILMDRLDRILGEDGLLRKFILPLFNIDVK
jgi:hypothetical protein